MSEQSIPQRLIPRATVQRDDGWPDLDLRPARDPDPLIPPGEYEAVSRSAEIRPTFSGRPTLFIKFDIHGGPYDGAGLFFAAPLPPRDRHGHFKEVAPSSKLYRAWVVASGGQKPKRRDRITLEPFKRRLFKVMVRTVTHDHEQQELPREQQYSVVDRLLERLA